MAISTIGSNARDYINLEAWLADLPSTLVQQEIAEMYNDSEFTTTGITISGITTTASFNMIIRPATGEAFNDTEQALRYNQSNGVGIRKTNSYGTVLFINNVDNVTVENIQLLGNQMRVQPLRLSEASNSVIRNNILQGTVNTPQFRTFNSNNCEAVNNVIVCTTNESAADGMNIVGSNWKVINNTFICLFAADRGLDQSYGASTSATVKNNTFLNFATPIVSSTWNTTNTDFNATDNGTIEGGSNNLTSLTIADQFEDLTLVSLDLRLKTGNDLDGAGTPESSFTNDEDIFGNARSLSAPSISAYETVAAGGISVTEQTTNSNYATLDPVISLTGAISIIESLVNTNYTVLNPVIDLTGSISITEQLTNVNYTSLNPVIDLTGVVSITELLKNINYTSLSPSITLTPTGVIVVNEQAVNTNYASLNPAIDLTGLVDITESLVNTNYNTLNPVITLTPSPIQIIEQTVSTQYNSINPNILLTPEPIGIVSTVCFDGVLVELIYSGLQGSLKYNGKSISIEFNGNFNELEFNGTIQTTCNPGSIKTNC